MAVTEIDTSRRSEFADGLAFGGVGPYEYLEGTAHFAVDPLNGRNRAITDLELAPRDANGKVVLSAHFAMLQPVAPERGNRRLLFDVVNRGRKTALSLNDVPGATDFLAPLQAGNGFLMRQGYTVVWCGWQADVPPTPGLIGLRAPEAIGPGGPLTGSILCQFQCNAPTQSFLLAHRDHLPHPPVDLDDPNAALTVRELPNSPAVPIDRGDWSFIRVEGAGAEVEPSHIYMPHGFQPGKIYQLVYRTKGSTIVGLGFAAVRDTVSFLKHASASEGNPCSGPIEYGYGFGRSQSGRFLRQMIHLGLNEDEEERIALDGIIAHVAGGMRGEFNLRFGQPSKDICYIIPELFPFTDTEQKDPVTGETGSLLARMEERGKVPKMMFTNTSAEYWRGRRGADPYRFGNHARCPRIIFGPALPFCGESTRCRRVPAGRGAGKRGHSRPASLQQRRLHAVAASGAGKHGPVGFLRRGPATQQAPEPIRRYGCGVRLAFEQIRRAA